MSVLRRSDSQILVDFRGGRTATINLYVKNRAPYEAMVTSERWTRRPPRFTELATVNRNREEKTQ